MLPHNFALGDAALLKARGDSALPSYPLSDYHSLSLFFSPCPSLKLVTPLSCHLPLIADSLFAHTLNGLKDGTLYSFNLSWSVVGCISHLSLSHSPHLTHDLAEYLQTLIPLLSANTSVREILLNGYTQGERLPDDVL